MAWDDRFHTKQLLSMVICPLPCVLFGLWLGVWNLECDHVDGRGLETL